jgi:CRISPR/Cas system-associated endonuclease Cas1
MQFGDNTFGEIRNGVLVLSGYAVAIRVEDETLRLRDGFRNAVTELSFDRAHCPISRLISIQGGGYITFDAVRWLHDIGAVIVHQNYDGTPLLVSAPRHTVSATLRRKQALLTADNPLGASIVQQLLQTKTALQIRVLEQLGKNDRANEARTHAERLGATIPLIDMLGIEGVVSFTYWQTIADIPVNFGRRQRIPDHWKVFGARRSPLSGSARNAVSAGQAMFNYCLGVLASEITIALVYYQS